MLKKLIANNRGDTIIEVLVVLAVLGLAVSIAYATANRSLLNARQAQENTEATEIAQSQLETIHSLSADPNSRIYSAGLTTRFCFLTSSPTTPSTAGCDNAFGNNNLYSVYDYNCSTDPGASPCTAITASNTFIVQVIWPDVADQGNDKVTLTYRVYPQP